MDATACLAEQYPRLVALALLGHKIDNFVLDLLISCLS